MFCSFRQALFLPRLTRWICLSISRFQLGAPARDAATMVAAVVQMIAARTLADTHSLSTTAASMMSRMSETCGQAIVFREALR